MPRSTRSRYPNPLRSKPLPPVGEGSKPSRPRSMSAAPPGGDEAWWASLGCGEPKPKRPPLTRDMDERDFNYRVDEWSPDGGSIQRTLALVDDLFMARQVFRMASAAQPDRWFTLRHRARVLDKHIPAP